MAEREIVYLMGGIGDGRLGDINPGLQTFIVPLPGGGQQIYNRTKVRVYTQGKIATVFKKNSQETKNVQPTQ